MSKQILPAASLRSTNRLPAARTWVEGSNHLIWMALWSIGRAIFGAASNFLPALREASRRARALLRRQCGEIEGGGHERAGVGMFGGGHHAVGGAGLDDLAVLHDQDLVGERAHDPQVVADEEVGEAVARLQFAQEVDDLRLH